MAWTTEQLDAIEKHVVDLSYGEALLYITVVQGMSYGVASEWISYLSLKHPLSRLAVHRTVVFNAYRFSKGDIPT
jgi:hypothetical protein